MNREVMTVGMVVKSAAGRDSGSWYVIVRVEDGFAYIADGKTHKLDKPKKKNPLHLRKTLTVLDLTDITDKKLRLALMSFGLRANTEESD
ncbi:MAG: KOW domain-containing RNA-binding protein [Eubacterium sp.]|nr:KOW domain-containing RNA-binding protein [Eubacterium sp.]